APANSTNVCGRPPSTDASTTTDRSSWFSQLVPGAAMVNCRTPSPADAVDAVNDAPPAGVASAIVPGTGAGARRVTSAGGFAGANEATTNGSWLRLARFTAARTQVVVPQSNRPAAVGMWRRATNVAVNAPWRSTRTTAAYRWSQKSGPPDAAS